MPKKMMVKSKKMMMQETTISLLTPNGGETWGVGNQESITWESENAPMSARVKISLSTDGGMKFRVIASAVDNTGSFNYTPVARKVSDMAMVKVEFIGKKKGTEDVSNGVFAITGGNDGSDGSGG